MSFQAAVRSLKQSYEQEWSASSSTSTNGNFGQYKVAQIVGNLQSELQLSSSFMSPSILAIIIKHTNEELKLLRKRNKDSRNLRSFDPTNEKEIKAMMDLRISFGMNGLDKVPVDSLFSRVFYIPGANYKEKLKEHERVRDPAKWMDTS